MIAAFLFAALLQAAPTYAISGTVVHGTAGSPLAKTRISAVSTVNSSPAQSMVTAADGRFHFEGLPAGKYRLTAERLGFSPQG